MAKILLPFDLNCDLGEGLENDALLMPFLGSCNIACGGHCGDEQSVKETLSLAKKNKVKVGAHPSFPDKVNFGRMGMIISEDELTRSLLSQIHFFQQQCQQMNMEMHHIKPHGALYNQAAKDEKIALLILNLIQNNFPEAPLYCPPRSIIHQLAKAKNIKYKLEAFADRTYQDDLSLTPRHLPNATLTDPEEVIAHIHPIIHHQKIMTLSGKFIPVKVDTLCLHGDNPNAYDILKAMEQNYKI